MKPIALRFVRALICSLTALLLLPRAQAQSTGTIEGRVFNPSTGEYVRNAEVRVQGMDRVAYSEEGGRFLVPNVPAGDATLVVSYTGYESATVRVPVTAGGVATRDVDLLPAARMPAPGEAVKLEAFTVSSDREGNAKAIMSQRRNMNISTSVASDIFGDVAEGNVGEFLKFLPGVDVEYVDAESRGPRLGGLDPQYVGVTVDGNKMASADAFASYNGMINGATGAGVRSMGFEQMSITSIESIEINRTTSADMDADAPAGTINLKTKRAFDRKGRRVDWQVSLSANSDDFTFGKTYRPGDHQSRLIRPDFTLDYSDVFLDQRLGIRLGLTQSKVLFQQQYVTSTYSNGATATDPRPQVLTALNFSDGPKFVDRAGIALTTDFKATSRLVLSMTSMFNSYDGATYTRSMTFTAAANNANTVTGRNAVLGDGLSDIRTNGLATSTSRAVTIAGNQNFDKLTNTITFSPRFEYTLPRLLIDGGGTYSHSKNDYEAIARGTIRVETLNPIVADFHATRPNPQSAEWTITQTSGADWSNLANYTNPRLSTDDDRYALVVIWQGDLNVKYTAPFSLPTFFKFGGKYYEEDRKSDNRNSYWSYAYVGPGGGTNGSFAAFPSPRSNATRYGDTDVLHLEKTPTFVNREALGALFKEHPEYFVNNATADNYYNAIYANHRDFKQLVDALYGMANTRVGKVSLQGGLRWERTETDSKEFDPVPAAQLPAQYPFNASTRRATTIAGIDYQYGSRPRVIRKGVYDNFFPSASVRYAILPNLHAQFGYAHSISRPPINSLSGVWSVNDTLLTVNAPNADLKPEISNNYVGRIAYYFEPVGSFSLLVQQNEISNKGVSGTLTAAQFGNDDPAYDNYSFITTSNSPILYRYRSLELNYSQQLTFLPGVLRGTSLNLGFTRAYANFWQPGVVPSKLSTVLGWRYSRVNFRLGAIWQDDQPYTTQFGRYMRHNWKLDLSGGFQLTKRTSLFFQGRNILDDPQLIFEGDPSRNVPAALYRFGNYGTSWVFGVKGSF